ncbi:MAG TPA: VCBS repeat-containing protein [Methylomirabilota bacterium]|nr:VCBS repeat-containing protein [Methylomirabilota bacterium]
MFFVAGVGDTNGDGVPDIYVGDYGSNNAGAAGGFAAVYSGVDGSRLHAWRGAAGEGVGPGREAGDVNGDGKVDLIIGSWTSSDGAPQAGKVQVVSGATGKVLRTITSLTPGEDSGFDAVGVGDTNGNGTLDYLVSAASLDTVYLIDGRR